MKQITFGQLIKEKRSEFGYSQEKLGDLLNVTRSYISKLENDRYDVPPSEKLVTEISLALNLDTYKLLRLCGRILDADQRILSALYIKYGDSFIQVFRKMHLNKAFAQKVFNLLHENS